MNFQRKACPRINRTSFPIPSSGTFKYLFSQQFYIENLLCLEKEMATYSSTLAWKFPWTEEPGRL